MKFCFASKKLPPTCDTRNIINFATKFVYNSPAYRQLQLEVKEAFLESDLAKQLVSPYEGDCEFDYWVCGRPNCDVDNYAKAILDSIQRAGIIKSDSQIQKLGGQKCQKCRKLRAGERCLYSFWCELRLQTSS